MSQATRARASRVPERPDWLTEPCEPWCDKQHRSSDHYDDRIHFGTFREIAQSMAKFVEVGGGAFEPRLTYVHLQRHYREIESIVIVCDGDDTETRYTLAEAEALAGALLAAVQEGSGRVAHVAPASSVLAAAKRYVEQQEGC